MPAAYVDHLPSTGNWQDSGGVLIEAPSGKLATHLQSLTFNIQATNYATLVVPTGWTLVRVDSSSYESICRAVFWAPGTVEDATWSISGTKVFDNVTAVITLIDGVDLTDPVRDHDGVFGAPDPADLPSPSVTAGEGDFIQTTYHQPQNTTDLLAAPSGYTRYYNGTSPARNTLMYREGAPAGATGDIPNNAQAAYENRIAQTIAWKSAGSGPTPVTATFSAALAVQEARAAALSVATAVQAPLSASLTTALVVQAPRTAATSVALAVQQALSAATMVQAAVQAPRTASASVAAAIQEVRSAAADLALVVQAAQAATTAVSLQVQADAAATTSVSLMVQAGNSASVSVAAAVQALREATLALTVAVSQANTAAMSVATAVRDSHTAGTAVSLQVQEDGATVVAVQTAVQFAASASLALQVSVAELRSASISLNAAVSLRQMLGTAVAVSVFGARLASCGISLYVDDPSVEIEVDPRFIARPEPRNWIARNEPRIWEARS